MSHMPKCPLLPVDRGTGNTKGSEEEGQHFSSPQLLGGSEVELAGDNWTNCFHHMVNDSASLSQSIYFFISTSLPSTLVWKRMWGDWERGGRH